MPQLHFTMQLTRDVSQFLLQLCILCCYDVVSLISFTYKYSWNSCSMSLVAQYTSTDGAHAVTHIIINGWEQTVVMLWRNGPSLDNNYPIACVMAYVSLCLPWVNGLRVCVCVCACAIHEVTDCHVPIIDRMQEDASTGLFLCPHLLWENLFATSAAPISSSPRDLTSCTMQPVVTTETQECYVLMWTLNMLWMM